jgi:hypothetical protein
MDEVRVSDRDRVRPEATVRIRDSFGFCVIVSVRLELLLWLGLLNKIRAKVGLEMW